MVFVIILWLYTGIVCGLAGLAVVRLFYRRTSPDGFDLPSLPLTVLVGLAVLSFVLQFLSLFISLGIIAHLVVIGCCLIFTALNFQFVRRTIQNYLRQFQTVSPLAILLYLLLSVIFLIWTANPSPSYDLGLYHIQAVKWIEQYPVVPGLGNLHGRLAFDSIWFIANAFFAPGSVGLAPSYVLNGFIFLLAAGYFLTGFGKNSTNVSGQVRFLKLALFGFFVLNIFGNFISLASSLSTDQPAMLLIPIILVLGVEFGERQTIPHEKKVDLNFWLIVILAAFSVLIKISTLPILLVPAYLLLKFYLRDNRKMVTVGVVLAGAFMPFVVRNIILSGYLVYPLPGLDFFNFDWKIPQAQVINEKNWIESWAKIPNRDQAEVLKLSLTEWFPTWWSNQSPLDLALLGGLLVLTLCNLGSFSYALLKKSPALSFYRQYGFLYLIFPLSSAYWFLSAPDFRFGYGFLLGLLVLLLLPALKYFEKVSARFKVEKGVLVLIIFWQILVFGFTVIVTPFQDILVTPYPVPIVSLRQSTTQNITVFSPENGDQCFDGPLPCTPNFNPGLGLRGSDLKSGFTSHCQPVFCFKATISPGFSGKHNKGSTRIDFLIS